MSFKTVIGKVLDVPMLIACVAGIAVFIFIIYHSSLASLSLYSAAVNLRSKMFYLGILIAVLTACMTFIETFVKAFAKVYRHLFTKQQ